MSEIAVTALIKCVETGEIREHSCSVDEEDATDDCFIWQDGNYACDCNRSAFFGEKQRVCSDDRFVVNLRRNDTGEIFYREYEG